MIKKLLSLWLIFIFAIVFTVAGCKKDKPPQSPPPTAEKTPSQPAKPTEPASAHPSTLTMNEVIKTARIWDPVYQSWVGKTAPDFTLTALDGKKHKLSDYRGKDVMIVFWATWCRPCIVEIPHIIALRKIINKDKLAILAVSFLSERNTLRMAKGFVAENKRINYPVFAVDSSAVPQPYKTVNEIPCSFFIDPQGKIKLATVNTLQLGEMKRILQAQWP